jgi:hypothetical protein
LGPEKYGLFVLISNSAPVRQNIPNFLLSDACSVRKHRYR